MDNYFLKKGRKSVGKWASVYNTPLQTPIGTIKDTSLKRKISQKYKNKAA